MKNVVLAKEKSFKSVPGMALLRKKSQNLLKEINF
jgi:hypothetical protein